MTALCAALQGMDLPFVRTREPGGSVLGGALRALLLDVESRVLPKTELFLYLADRAQHVEEVIRPALAAGRIVVSDRYADSTVVYQGYGRGLDVERLLALNEDAVDGLWPDVTLLYDLPPEIGLARARSRNEATGLARAEGRFEAEAMAFHRRIRQGYLEWAARFPERYQIVNADAPADEVARQSVELVMNHLSSHLS